MEADIGRPILGGLVRIKPRSERMRMDVLSSTVNYFKWAVHEARCDLSVSNSTTTVTTTKTAEKGDKACHSTPERKVKMKEKLFRRWINFPLDNC